MNSDTTPGIEIGGRARYDRRLAALRSDRSSWLTHYTELSDFILPRRGRFLGTANQGNRGDRRNTRIIDGTATRAARDLGSGLKAGLTSPARPWLRYTTADPDLSEYAPVRRWLDNAQDVVARVLKRSNFYQSIHGVYENLGVFGTGGMVAVEDRRTVVRFVPLSVGEFCCANGDDGTTDTLYREIFMTIGQLVERFGISRVSAAARVLHQGSNFDTEVAIVHAIEPNRGNTGVPARFGWVSCYYEVGGDNDAMLEAKGYETYPAMVPRWYVDSNDAYGRSPGMEALPDIRALQINQKTKAKTLDKRHNPPMTATLAMQNMPASVLPGGVTYVPGIDGRAEGFRPAYEVTTSISDILQDIDDLRMGIKETFFVDLFRMISQLETVRTAEEIVARKEEKLLMLGPVLERLDNELLDPAVDRTFDICMRTGMFPPAPPELRGQKLDVQYVSILAQAQRAVSMGGIERWIALGGNLAGIKPEVADKIDADQIMDEAASVLGVPNRLVVTDEKVEALRKARADAQHAQEQGAAGLASVQGAKLLSETDVGGGQNALQAALGMAA